MCGVCQDSRRVPPAFDSFLFLVRTPQAGGIEVQTSVTLEYANSSPLIDTPTTGSTRPGQYLRVQRRKSLFGSCPGDPEGVLQLVCFDSFQLRVVRFFLEN